MAQRNSSMLLAMVLVACATYCILPARESFVAPSPSSSLRAGAATPLAQGYEIQARDIDVSMAAQTPSENQGMTSPRKINLLFLALLAGSAAFGLIAVLGYGAYSGAGSSI